MGWEEEHKAQIKRYTDNTCNMLINDFDDTLTMCFDRREVFGYLFETYGGNGVDPQDRMLFTELAKGKKSFLDVGANIGFYTMLACKHMAPDAKIVAIEPGISNYRYLLASILLNRFEAKAVVERVAVADHAGEGRLSIAPVGMQVGNSLSVSAAGWTSEQIHISTVDEVCESNGISVLELMKIDIEGYELKALRGAKNILARSRGKLQVICEINRNILSCEEIDEILALFHADFANVRTFDAGKREVKSNTDMPNAITNIVCS